MNFHNFRLDDNDAALLIDANSAWALKIISESSNELTITIEYLYHWPWRTLHHDEQIMSGQHCHTIRIEQGAGPCARLAEFEDALATNGIEQFHLTGIGIDHRDRPVR